MLCIVIGVFIFVSGFACFTAGESVLTMLPASLVCFALGGVLIRSGYKSMKNPKPKSNTIATNSNTTFVPVQTSPPVGTFTFEPTGTRFECKFPIKGFAMRQRVLQKSKVGDPITLQLYEWEGKPAVAVMNARLGVDLGVAKKAQSSKLNKLMNEYDVAGKIVKFTDFDMKNENYLSCEIQLDYYERQ